MIRFDHVSKSYKGTSRPALDDITTEILRGEFVFVVGASGSGKSTFLRLILREERPTRGKLHVLGQNLGSISNRKVPYFRRNVGVVFQDFRLLANKTVFDNVAFTLQVLGKSKGFIHEAVPDVLAMVGLDGKAHRYPHELSGGEQQRVAIARAVVNKPQILLADEPTGNLDPATSAGITAVLERINASGTTVLMATHEAGLVDRMQKRVIELVDGKIVRDERHGGYGVTAAVPVLGGREDAVEGEPVYAAAIAGATVPQEATASAGGIDAGRRLADAPPVERSGSKPTRAERKEEKKAAKHPSRARLSEKRAVSVTTLTAGTGTAAVSVGAAGARDASRPTQGTPTQGTPAQGTPTSDDRQVARSARADGAATPPGQASPEAAAAPASAAGGHVDRQPSAPAQHDAPSPAPQPVRQSGAPEPVGVAVPREASSRSESVLDAHFAGPPAAPVLRQDSSDVAELTLAERLGLRAPGKHDHEDDSNQDVGPVS